VILEQDEWGAWLDPSKDVAGLMEAVRAERFELTASADQL
jgi:putative SOS response-associated peptidase YedK